MTKPSRESDVLGYRENMPGDESYLQRKRELSLHRPPPAGRGGSPLLAEAGEVVVPIPSPFILTPEYDSMQFSYYSL